MKNGTESEVAEKTKENKNVLEATRFTKDNYKIKPMTLLYKLQQLRN
jgi:hypothetical protein